MALLDLNIRELCDWRTKTFNRAGYDTIMAADPAVTTKLLAGLDNGRYHHTPYWKAVAMAAVKHHGHACARCGGRILRAIDGAVYAPPAVVPGTEHRNLDKLTVTHRNGYACTAYRKVHTRELVMA